MQLKKNKCKKNRWKKYTGILAIAALALGVSIRVHAADTTKLVENGTAEVTFDGRKGSAIFTPSKSGQYVITTNAENDWDYVTCDSIINPETGSATAISSDQRIDTTKEHRIIMTFQKGKEYKLHMTLKDGSKLTSENVGLYTDLGHGLETISGFDPQKGKLVTGEAGTTLYKVIIPKAGYYTAYTETTKTTNTWFRMYDAKANKLKLQGGGQRIDKETVGQIIPNVRAVFKLDAGTYYISADMIERTDDVVDTMPKYSMLFRETIMPTGMDVVDPRELKEGEAASITYHKYIPEDCDVVEITYKSSNEKIAIIKQVNGRTKVYGKAGGTATITAYNLVGTKIASWDVKVDGNPPAPDPKPTPVKVSRISISSATKIVAYGKSVQLKAIVTPAKAANKAVTWKSSNTKYATVSSTGKVTTKKAGRGKTVTLTATAKDGSKVSGKYTIKIAKGIVTKIKITGASSVKNGKTVALKAKITATAGAYKTLTWTSSNTKYATVSSAGKVTAKKAGKGKKVKITAKAKDGSGKYGTITIKIK